MAVVGPSKGRGGAVGEGGGSSSVIGVADYGAQAAKTSGLKVYLSAPLIGNISEITEWDLKGVLRHDGIQAHKDIWTNAAQTKGIRLTFMENSGIAYDHDRGNNWRVYRGVANGNLVLTQNDGNAIFLLDGEILTGYTAAQLKTVIDNNAILTTAYFGGEDGTTELFENLTTTQIFGALAQGGSNFVDGAGPQSVGAQVSAADKTVTVRSKLTDNLETIKSAIDAIDGLISGVLRRGRGRYACRSRAAVVRGLRGFVRGLSRWRCSCRHWSERLDTCIPGRDR